MAEEAAKQSICVGVSYQILFQDLQKRFRITTIPCVIITAVCVGWEYSCTFDRGRYNGWPFRLSHRHHRRRRLWSSWYNVIHAKLHYCRGQSLILKSLCSHPYRTPLDRYQWLSMSSLISYRHRGPDRLADDRPPLNPVLVSYGVEVKPRAHTSLSGHSRDCDTYLRERGIKYIVNWWKFPAISCDYISPVGIGSINVINVAASAINYSDLCGGSLCVASRTILSLAEEELIKLLSVAGKIYNQL